MRARYEKPDRISLTDRVAIDLVCQRALREGGSRAGAAARSIREAFDNRDSAYSEDTENRSDNQEA